MATSKLQERLYVEVCRCVCWVDIDVNCRPAWLRESTSATALELDIFIPHLEIAIEVQGAQHYQFTPFFHGDWQGFQDMLQRDEAKQGLCEAHGVTLLHVFDDVTMDEAVATIRRRASVFKFPLSVLGVALPIAFVQWAGDGRRGGWEGQYGRIDSRLNRLRVAIVEQRSITDIARMRRSLRKAISRHYGYRVDHDDGGGDWMRVYQRGRATDSAAVQS